MLNHIKHYFAEWGYHALVLDHIKHYLAEWGYHAQVLDHIEHYLAECVQYNGWPRHYSVEFNREGVDRVGTRPPVMHGSGGLRTIAIPPSRSECRLSAST